MSVDIDRDADRHWDAIVIHADDDVAVALRDIRCGDVVRVQRQGAVRNMTIRDDVPLGHKFALHSIAAGAELRKYGETIGGATTAIAEGEHVHVHNMASLRARPQ